MDEARDGSGAGGSEMDDGVAGADGEEGGMLAADKATWHKWLSKRESEASREPSTAATLLCAAKLPQMVSEMLKSAFCDPSPRSGDAMLFQSAFCGPSCADTGQPGQGRDHFSRWAPARRRFRPPGWDP